MESPAVAEKSILIIDDDALILESLAHLFKKEGWEVDTCRNGKEGLDRLAGRRYECTLLDIRMPVMTGDELIERLRYLEEGKKIDRQKVIIMTGYSDENAAVKVFQLGAFHFLHKPFDNSVLLEKAKACLDASKVTQVFDNAPVTVEEEQTFKKLRKLYDSESVRKKADILSRRLEVPLKHIKGCTYDTEYFKGNIENPIGVIQIPLGIAGPISVKGDHAKGDFWVPMATTEGALLLTYDLGMRLLQMSGPVEVEVVSKGIHITPMFPVKTNEDSRVGQFVNENYENIKKVAEGDSRHTKLLRIEQHKVGTNFLLKFVYDTSDAHGLNMINHATFNACKYIEAKTEANFYHRSHFSGVKHHSLLNEEKGYGRVVKASATVSGKALGMLKVTAQQMEDFGSRCIECGHAAGIASVNVHAANAVAAIFLACGQDVADLTSSAVCSSRCVAVNNGKDLRVDVVLRNLLVGTVGGGTGLGTQAECLKIMGCFGPGKSDKFAEIIAATALAGEFTTAAAVINRSYVDIHNKYGRNKSKHVPS